LKTKNFQSRADKKKATLLRGAVGMNEWRHVYAIIFQAAYTLGCIQQTDACSLTQLRLLWGQGNDFEHVLRVVVCWFVFVSDLLHSRRVDGW